ncbi:HPF/RaiA family ribosome-associated protein [Alcaligenaceae bacterium CGII-47]|nr:HPF/RaiA family ribosome-associated protein [Alcaligenaceae bacterium CGII-47]
MKVQINTDSNISISQELGAEIQEKIDRALKRFSDRITRIEVHLSDLDSTKAGPDDKRCVIEARVAGLNPVTVSHSAQSSSLAVDGACEKIVNALNTVFGRRDAVQHDKIIPSDSSDPA